MGLSVLTLFKQLIMMNMSPKLKVTSAQLSCNINHWWTMSVLNKRICMGADIYEINWLDVLADKCVRKMRVVDQYIMYYFSRQTDVTYRLNPTLAQTRTDGGGMSHTLNFPLLSHSGIYEPKAVPADRFL